MKKRQEGITLVVLIITIIVMLILAGVTIGQISDHKGIINQTRQTTKNAQRESIVEKIKADIYTEKTKKGREITEEEFKSIIKQYGKVTDDENDEGKIILTTDDGGYKIEQSEIWK